MIELRGTIYYGKERDSALSELIWDKHFNYDFEWQLELQGVWIFHSKKLNQVLILMSHRKPFLEKKIKGWRSFDVYAEKELDLKNIFEEFDYPKK